MAEELTGQEQRLERSAAAPHRADVEIVRADPVKWMLNVASSQPARAEAKGLVVRTPDGMSPKLRRESSGAHPCILSQRE